MNNYSLQDMGYYWIINLSRKIDTGRDRPVP